MLGRRAAYMLQSEGQGFAMLRAIGKGQSMAADVNEFSATPIADDQLVAWPRVAAVSAMVSFSLPTFITGLEVAQGLPPTETLWALIWGSVILTVIGTIMGVIGAKTRMSSYLLVRAGFGDLGASIVNVAFAISLLGWFGININLFADAVARAIIKRQILSRKIGLSDERTLTTRPFSTSGTTEHMMSQVWHIVRLVVTPSRVLRGSNLASATSCGSIG